MRAFVSGLRRLLEYIIYRYIFLTMRAFPHLIAPSLNPILKCNIEIITSISFYL